MRISLDLFLNHNYMPGFYLKNVIVSGYVEISSVFHFLNTLIIDSGFGLKSNVELAGESLLKPHSYLLRKR